MYRITTHELIEEDLRSLSKKDQDRILGAIERKLSSHPDVFGKPLGKVLKGFYRLRVGPYRIVYKIEKQKIMVFVIHVGFRRDEEVYREAIRRLS